MGIERGAEDTTPAKSAGWGQRLQQVRGCSGLVRLRGEDKGKVLGRLWKEEAQREV